MDNPAPATGNESNDRINNVRWQICLVAVIINQSASESAPIGPKDMRFDLPQPKTIAIGTSWLSGSEISVKS